MGLGDITSTVLTRYKADTKDHKRQLRGLKGEELKRHKALLKQMEEQNAEIDGQIEKWGKVAAGIAATGAAVAVAAKGFQVFQRDVQLANATAGVNIDGLKKSVNGLVTEVELLEFASSAMNGTFKLSQKEMETALKGAMALRAQGKDLTVTLERIGQAVREGNVEPLKELGLIIKGAENDTEAGLQAALKALNDESEKMMGKTGLAGDGVQQGMIEAKDATREMAHAVGELTAAMAPLIKALARMLTLASMIPQGFSDFVDSVMGTSSESRKFGSVHTAAEQGFATKITQLEKDLAEAKKVAATGLPGYSGEVTRIEQELALMRAARAGARQNWASEVHRNRKGVFTGAFGRLHQLGVGMPGGGTGGLDGGAGGSAGGPYTFGGAVLRNGIGNPTDSQLAAIAAAEGGFNNNVLGVNGASAAYGQGLQGPAAQAQAAVQQMLKDFQAANIAKNESMISRVFGTPAEIDATAMALGQLSGVMDGFTGAFGAGVDALITGSASFSEAFKGAIAESLRSMAVEMSMQAIRHTAYGVGSLFINPGASAGHFKAAGLFAAGATVAGIAANQMGAGQVRSGAPSGRAPTGSAGVGAANPNAGGDSGTHNIFIVGNDFAGLPAAQRESQWREISRKAGVSIEGDAIVNG